MLKTTDMNIAGKNRQRLFASGHTMALMLIVFLTANILFVAMMGIAQINNRFINLIYIQPGITGFMLAGLTIICFLTWEYRVHRNLEALGARGLKRKSRWAVIWYFVPFANLVMPYLVLREIWKGSNPYADLSNAFAWKNSSVPNWMLAWWISWILSGAAWKFWFINYTLSIEGLALAILFVWKIDSRQLRKYLRLADTGALPVYTAPPVIGQADIKAVVERDSATGLVWSYKTDGEIVSSPACSDGTVFFGSDDHHLYALDIQTGELKWRFRADGPIDSSPAVAGGVVCFAGNAVMICVDAGSGKERWHRKIKASPPPSPAISGGLIYWGGFDSILHASDLASGDERWQFHTKDIIDCMPAVADEVVYLGSYDKHMYAIGATSGELLWQVKTAGPIDSPPAISTDKVYFGSQDKNLHAVSKETGAPLWTFPTAGAVSSRPVLAGELVIFGSYDNYLYALDAASGVQKWDFRTENCLASSPVIVNGVAYFGSYDRMFYAVDCSTGQEKWRFPTRGWIHSSPAVHDGLVFFGSKDGRFYAVREE